MSIRCVVELEPPPPHLQAGFDNAFIMDLSFQNAQGAKVMGQVWHGLIDRHEVIPIAEQAWQDLTGLIEGAA